MDRESLILSHLPRVRGLAYKFHRRLPKNVSVEELISIGSLALILAVDDFDTTRNISLWTYAEYRVRGALLDSIRGLDWASRTQRKRAKRLEHVKNDLQQRLQRTVTETEIADELGVPVQALVKYQGLPTLCSIDTGMQVPSGIDPYLLLEQKQKDRLLRNAFRRLTRRQQQVLSLYKEGFAPAEISVRLKITLWGVAGYRIRALAKLKAICASYTVS